VSFREPTFYWSGCADFLPVCFSASSAAHPSAPRYATKPKSQAKVVPNAGHFTMIDAAQMVSEEIGKFAGAVAQS